jgi:hypothetical protein
MDGVDTTSGPMIVAAILPLKSADYVSAASCGCAPGEFAPEKRNEPPVNGGSLLGEKFGGLIRSGQRNVERGRTFGCGAPGDAIGR